MPLIEVVKFRTDEAMLLKKLLIAEESDSVGEGAVTIRPSDVVES